MSYGNFDFAKGTKFEQAIFRWFWKKYPDKINDYGKPDIYDCVENVMYEAKCTRPYYDDDPGKNPMANDIGTGLPTSQFNRYVKMMQHGIRFVMIHKMTAGKYTDQVFVTEINQEMVLKVKKSWNGNTRYWLYEDLNKINNDDLTIIQKELLNL